jgi:glucose-fructose oxidoreductase
MRTPISASVLSRRRFLGQLSAVGALTLASRSLLAADQPARPLGVALVGLGGYSSGQLGPALKLTKLCRLAGVVTGSPEKGKRWAKEYGFPETSIYGYDTMARMADNPDIDIVYVVTPNSLHARDTIAAAKAGKHVICEKPMAVSVAECDAMIAACQEARVRLAIGYRLHYDPFHEELRRLVRTQEFGPFLKMDGGFAFTMGNMQWRAQRKWAGGGPLMDLGVYVIQEAYMAAGDSPVVAITAKERPKQRPEFFADVEESLDWTMEFANGAKAVCYTSYNDNRNDFRAEAKGGWYQVGPAYSYNGLRAATSGGPVDVAPLKSQQALQMDAFARDILEQRPSLVPAEMGRRDMVIVEAIYASAAAGGKRVEVKA